MTLTSPSHSPPRGSIEPGSRLQFLPGVGPQRALALERMGLVTVEDLLRHYPRAYLDARRFVPIARLVPGELLTVSGSVTAAAAIRTRAGRTDFTLRVEDGTGTLTCYFFGQSFLGRTLKRGVRVVVSGELDALERRMMNPMFEVVEDDTAAVLNAGRLVPVHALTRGVSARLVRGVVRTALDRVAARVEDPLPADVREALDLAPLAWSLGQAHFPDDDPSLERARRRLAFEELFEVQAVLAVRRRVLAQQAAGLLTAGDGAAAGRARAALPFILTPDQERALADIVRDMRAPRPMHRMVLGDVGSGKTVVAFLACAHAVDAGFQAAFMAPTEILARQHAATLARLAAPAGIAVESLTAGTPPEARRRLRARLAAGEPLLAVGTHALLEDDVAMPRLGLVVVDEQHRFGVAQRSALAQKGALPDVLVMTATPIPRTLALACYGDLDVTRIEHRPPGRGRLVTRVTGEDKLDAVIEFMERELEAGRQAFVVVPAIEEGAPRTRSAQAEHRRLAAHPRLARFRVELLHGRMRADGKRAVMEAFATGAAHVLVATTVVEVGVDVPNATLMVVLGAEAFGLTQLHQLRGRVGRGDARSVCVLVHGPGLSAASRERLQVLADTDDGFVVAEADLKLRGPGEAWGTRQSGLPRFKIADLARDAALLERAHEAARRLIDDDPQLARAEHRALRRVLLDRFPEPLGMALAG